MPKELFGQCQKIYNCLLNNVMERRGKADVMDASLTKKEMFFVFKWLTMHLKNYTKIIASLWQDARARRGQKSLGKK
jgi:hypothetical protein